MTDSSAFHSKYSDLIAAHKLGTLHQWVQDHLKKEGSHGLASELEKHNVGYIELINVPLSLLKRIEGPEPLEQRESLSVWDDRVGKFEKQLAEGYVPPPLIVTDFWQPLEIADGNHRHEALMRNGVETYWTIFFIKDEGNVKLLEGYK